MGGSMSVPPGTLYRAVVSHGRALAKAGYGFVVVTNGHGGPRHAAGLEAACRWVSRRHRIAMFTPSTAVLHRIVTGGRFELTERSHVDHADRFVAFFLCREGDRRPVSGQRRDVAELRVDRRKEHS